MSETLPAGVHRLSVESQAVLIKAKARSMPSWRATRNRSGWPPHPSRRWIRSVTPEWRWSGLLTRAQVVRNHPDPPLSDLCPQRPRERILNPSRKHRRFESDQVLQIKFALVAKLVDAPS